MTVRILQGDVRNVLQTLTNESVRADAESRGAP